NLMDKETLSRQEVLKIFAPIEKRPTRGSYTGYGKRLAADRPPVLTPKERALTAAEVNDHPAAGNGQTGAIGGGSGQSSSQQPGGGQGQGPSGSGEGREAQRPAREHRLRRHADRARGPRLSAR